jgi:hypothetical protein
MQRISPEYLDELVYELYLYMDSILKGGLYITDSTGFVCDRYEERNIKMEETTVIQTVKLHVAVKYYPRYGVTAVVTGTVSHGTAHDSPYFPYLIRNIYGPAFLFCDRGYDSEDNRRRAYKQHLTPIIKERKTCGNSLIRIKARKDFNEILYKNFRGMVEGVFGGMETGYNNKTRCRLQRTRQTDVMLLAVVQNLKACFKVQALLKEVTY